MPYGADGATFGGAGRCRIYLVGPFAVTDAEGNDLTPKPQKAKALLAMLSLAPRGSRSRVWLRDKLWSDRSQERAQASLRQTLLEVRMALGPLRDLITADQFTLWLNTGRVDLDIDSLVSTPDQLATELAAEHFLEGFDIRDAEFDDWLLLQRQVWRNRLDKKTLGQILPLRMNAAPDGIANRLLSENAPSSNQTAGPA